MSRKMCFLAGLVAIAVSTAAPSRDSMADPDAAVKSRDQATPTPSSMAIRQGGKLYEDVEFISTTGENVTFESREGPLMAKWMDLPEEIRKRFQKDYDNSLREQQAAVMTDFGVARFSGPVVQKLRHGIIASWGGMLMMLTGYPNESSLTKGQIISVNAQRTGSYPYTDNTGKTKIIRRFKVLSLQ